MKNKKIFLLQEQKTMQKVYMLLPDYVKIKNYAKAGVHFSDDISLKLSLDDFTFTTRHSNWSKQNNVYISVDKNWVKEMRKRIKHYATFQVLQNNIETKLKTTKKIKLTTLNVLD